MKVSMPKERLEFYFFSDRLYYRCVNKMFSNIPVLKYIWSCLDSEWWYRHAPYTLDLNNTHTHIDPTWKSIKDVISS